jgi:histidine triad (HIT) family protein
MSCEFCDIPKEKIIYEDESLIVTFPSKMNGIGQLIVVPKKHAPKMQDLDDKEIEHLFYCASFCATTLFEQIGAHGTNIIANTGSELKRNGHFHIQVVARKTDDGAKLMWTPMQLPEEEMNSVKSKIKDECFVIGSKKGEIVEKAPAVDEPKKEEGKKQEKTQTTEKKDNIIRDKYLIDQLRRIP